MSTGLIIPNVPGGIYIIKAECKEFEDATGRGMYKIGLHYGGVDGTYERAFAHKTSCPHKIKPVRIFAVDENTAMPSLRSETNHTRIGGVYEMEQMLHALMIECGAKNIGDGNEWFSIPLKFFADREECPSLQNVLAAAPRFEDVTAFKYLGQHTSMQKTTASAGWAAVKAVLPKTKTGKLTTAAKRGDIKVYFSEKKKGVKMTCSLVPLC
tara:strand:+ start:100 stop:732 length:633 start_codon:yes stop_codon:yes gene_type:complete